VTKQCWDVKIYHPRAKGASTKLLDVMATTAEEAKRLAVKEYRNDPSKDSSGRPRGIGRVTAKKCRKLRYA
jgi:hypothetical protein